MKIGIISEIKTKIVYLCSGFSIDLPQNRRGFALVEIAVALSIMGIISGFLITKMVATNRLLRSQITKNNIETSTFALAAYVANHSKLPLPIPDKDTVGGGELSEFIGRIPYNKIGISEKNTKDGKGKYLTYVVEPLLSSAQLSSIYGDDVGFQQCFCSNIGDPFIRCDSFSDTIAFVIDEGSKKPTISSGKILITATENTMIISRDLLLMKYLKSRPCKKIDQNLEINQKRQQRSPDMQVYDGFQ